MPPDHSSGCGRFEWDADKVEANVQKHGTGFKIVVAVFDDPPAERYHDRIAGGEKRIHSISPARPLRGELIMEIKKTQDGSTEILSLTGRLDTVTAPKLQEVLADAISSAEKVELDFAGVDYVSSAGLRVLLVGEKSSKAAGKAMTLKNVSQEVMEVFEMTGFSGILTIA
jgi:anti-anti-sigma factor